MVDFGGDARETHADRGSRMSLIESVSQRAAPASAASPGQPGDPNADPDPEAGSQPGGPPS